MDTSWSKLMFRNSSVFLWHGENIMHEHDYDYTILVTGLAEYIDIQYSTLPLPSRASPLVCSPGRWPLARMRPRTASSLALAREWPLEGRLPTLRSGQMRSSRRRLEP